MERSHTRRVGLGFEIMLLVAAGIAQPAIVVGAEEMEAAKTGRTEVVVTTDEVVVSATKTPVPVKELTSAVEIITGEELKRRKIKTVVDALRLSQGLAVFSNGGPGTLANVRIRGASPEQTLVLLDGAVLNDSIGGAFNFANLTTDNIEKIEILRGAQSMIWGSDAIGGVINITTKRGRDVPKARAFFEYGSFLSIREGASFSGQLDPVDFSLALSRWDFTGFSAASEQRGAIERDAHRNWQGSTRLGLALPWDSRLDFAFRWLNGDTDIDNVFSGSISDAFKAKSTSNQLVYSGSYRQPLTSWWEQVLTAARQTDDRMNHNGTLQRDVETGAISSVFVSLPTDTFDTTSNRIEWQHNLEVHPSLLLTLGYQFREQLGEATGNFPFPTKIVSSHAGFAEGQFNLWDRVFATAGFRQDEFNVFGSATTWRLTGGYAIKETGTKLRGSYGTGFRAPNIQELFFPGFGNPNLQPEKSQSLDVGIDQSLLRDSVNIGVTYFWNRFRNLIEAAPSFALCGPNPFSPADPASCPQNIGVARAKGWEAQVGYHWDGDHPLVKFFEVTAQYTNTFTQDLERASFLPRWPQHQASAVLGYTPIEPLLLNLEMRFVGERFNSRGNQGRVDSFTVVNLAASYDLTRHLQTYLRVDNLFDEEYEEVLGFGAPIRSIYGGIRGELELDLF